MHLHHDVLGPRGQARDVGDAELRVLEREAGGVANVPLHLHWSGDWSG